MQLENHQGFPSGAVVDNPPANAGNKFSSWSGKIPHAAEQVSPSCAPEPGSNYWDHPHAATAEVCVPWRLCSETTEASTRRSPHTTGESPLLATTRKKARTATKTQHSHEKYTKSFLKFTEREALKKGSNIPYYFICKINPSPIKRLKSWVEDHAILTFNSYCQSAL